MTRVKQFEQKNQRLNLYKNKKLVILVYFLLFGDV